MHIRRNQVAVAFSGTTEWIKTHPTFEKWNQEESGILWIQGKPGSGKSVLAKSILNQACQSSPDLLMASWFYSKRGGEIGMSHTSMIRSICCQLLRQRRTLFQACAHIYHLNHDAVLEELPAVLEAIVTRADGPPILCLLDGLDESADRDEKGGHDILQRLAEWTENPGSRFKVIVLSRPYSSIEEVYGTYDILLEAENGADIPEIVDQGISSLAHALDRHNKPEAMTPFARRRRQQLGDQSVGESPAGGEITEVVKQQEVDAIKAYLLKHAQGVTLWVTLSIGQAVRYTKRGPCTWTTIRNMLAGLPLELNEMYRMITTELAKDCVSEHIQMGRKVLAWVIAAGSKRPLLVKELFDALSIPDNWPPSDEPKEPLITDPLRRNRPICRSWPDFCRSIFDICGPLVEFVNASELGTFQYDLMSKVTGGSVVQLVHQTAKDFLENVHDNIFAFKPGEARSLVEAGTERYLRLVLPLENTAYVPVLDNVSDEWRRSVAELLLYLDDKYLLPFVIAQFPLPNEYCDIQTRWMLSPFFYDMSYRDINVVGVLEQIVVGACFTLACEHGLPTTIDNLLYLTSLSPIWWRAHRDIALTAASRVAVARGISDLAHVLSENHRDMFNRPAIRHGDEVTRTSGQRSATAAIHFPSDFMPALYWDGKDGMTEGMHGFFICIAGLFGDMIAVFLAYKGSSKIWRDAAPKVWAAALGLYVFACWELLLAVTRMGVILEEVVPVFMVPTLPMGAAVIVPLLMVTWFPVFVLTYVLKGYVFGRTDVGRSCFFLPCPATSVREWEQVAMVVIGVGLVASASHGLAFFRSCRRAYAEIGRRWLHQVVFHFDDIFIMLDTLTAIPRDTLCEIKNVRVSANALGLLGEYGLYLDTLTVLGSRIPQLGYCTLTSLIHWRMGWRELCYVSPDSRILAFSNPPPIGVPQNEMELYYRFSRYAKPATWQENVNRWEKEGHQRMRVKIAGENMRSKGRKRELKRMPDEKMLGKATVTIFRSDIPGQAGSSLCPATRTRFEQDPGHFPKPDPWQNSEDHALLAEGERNRRLSARG
ncbi:hypothetical protein B0H66DRAFT_599245 [Apodospora peruviana]|uniref:NACHT domain-containing protein n=1 Tax=Apodospora peruviana TaxID=516989 RepID=A0AAE0IHB0_9PEZI|nr:hypothetical protein B0H66DRAFT_599245 [Apodospora peruviana]